MASCEVWCGAAFDAVRSTLDSSTQWQEETDKAITRMVTYVFVGGNWSLVYPYNRLRMLQPFVIVAQILIVHYCMISCISLIHTVIHNSEGVLVLLSCSCFSLTRSIAALQIGKTLTKHVALSPARSNSAEPFLECVFLFKYRGAQHQKLFPIQLKKWRIYIYENYTREAVISICNGKIILLLLISAT